MPVETFLLNVIRSLSNGYSNVGSIFSIVPVRVPQSDSDGKVETRKEADESGKPQE